MDWWKTILDFVYPKLCVGCGSEGESLCNKCFDTLTIAEQVCPVCGGSSDYGWTHSICRNKGSLDGLICLYSYEDETVKAAIDDLKFGFNKEIVPLMMRNFSFESGVRFDAIVPVPLYFYRENWRGFNQAQLIAEKIDEGLSLGVEKWLVRRKNTKQQANLRSREDRGENMTDAFEVRGEVKGSKVLLTDDVYTSGFSMGEAAKTLKTAGASFVWGLVLAH